MLSGLLTAIDIDIDIELALQGADASLGINSG